VSCVGNGPKDGNGHNFLENLPFLTKFWPQKGLIKLSNDRNWRKSANDGSHTKHWLSISIFNGKIKVNTMMSVQLFWYLKCYEIFISILAYDRAHLCFPIHLRYCALKKISRYTTSWLILDQNHFQWHITIKEAGFHGLGKCERLSEAYIQQICHYIAITSSLDWLKTRPSKARIGGRGGGSAWSDKARII